MPLQRRPTIAQVPGRADALGAWGQTLNRCRRRIATLLLSLLALGLFATGAAAATVLRIASGYDPQTMDPQALALLYHSRVAFQVYDCLVNRDEQFRLEPALATTWQAVTPTTWRFNLRRGVKFHDGTPFTADDAVFSVQRALGPTSERAFTLRGLKAVTRIDDATIQFQLEAPDAVWPEKLVFIAMMSRAWAAAHGVEKAQDFNGKQETYAVRNANGTGPFRLERYEPDVRTVLKRNPDWWGRADPRNGNLDEVQFIVIRADATRLAALSSGEVDLVLDPPFQDVERLKADPRLALKSIADIGTQYFAFDTARDELIAGDQKTRNPFKDVRVRRAVAHALNLDLIVAKVLRGQAVPTGSFVSPRVTGWRPEFDRRLPHDPARAKALLKEAGYPDGFGVTLDCVNIAWREAACQAAAAMLTQVGIRTSLRSTPPNQFFPKLSQATASLIEFGWTPTPDPWSTFNALLHTWDASGPGSFNAGRYSRRDTDEQIDAIRTEADPARRSALIQEVLRTVADDLPYLPLYRRTLNWAMDKRVEVVQWPNDVIELRWVRRAGP